MKKTAKISFLLFFSLVHSIAQIDSLSFYEEPQYIKYPTDPEYLSEEISVPKTDRTKWKNLTENIDYTEKKLEEKEESEPADFNPEGIATVGKILMYLFIAVGIGALIFIISKFITEGNFKFKKNKSIKAGFTTYDLNKIEENLPDFELKTPIEKAIADKNFPLAIRLYYLSVIQELSAKEIINWKKEKTNFEYIQEMRNHHLNNDFRKVTQIFERVWYGDKEINEEDFRKVQPVFLQLSELAQKAGK